MINLRKESIKWDVSKISPQDGDILILKSNNPGAIDLQKINQILKDTDKDIWMLVLSDNCDLEHVSESEMNRCGWFRNKDNKDKDKVIFSNDKAMIENKVNNNEIIKWELNKYLDELCVEN